VFLFIDANVIVGNPLLRGRHWDAVGDAAASGTLDFYVPELAVAEAVARYRDAAKVRERALSKELRRWPPDAREQLDGAILNSRSFSSDYESLLRKRLEQMGAVITDYPDVPHSDVAKRAIRRAAPFDIEGNGYRDTLHWYSFIELLEELEPEDPFAFLLSGDKRAFGPQRQTELLAEVEALGVEWEVAFLASIAAFVVPGQFLDEDTHLDWAQGEELQAAVRDGLLAGGLPDDFTHVIADRAHFDNAQIVDVLSLSVQANRVQMERKSRDLWIGYSARAMCQVELETIEVLDEESGDYAVIRDTKSWELMVSGYAYSSGQDIENVASLRLDDIEDPAQEAEPFPHR
jgi:hypothetical protein